jgi:serine/threonine protein kinase
MTTRYQPDARVSEYILEACLGNGTFGEVWKARHHVWDNDHVAIKLPTEPEYVRFLQREGVVVHGLRHPNIVRVLGLDPYGDPPYLVMELVDGPSLRDVLNEHPQGLPLDVAVTVLRGILSAIIVAHESNIVHRDLKPGNVLLNLGGKPLEQLELEQVKVGDFGLGVSNADTLRSLVMQSASIAQDRESTAIAGTLAYMAPEVRDGKSPAPQSDLYAIGVILFELLTGERPAGTETPSVIRTDAPPALDEVFNRLYARAERRYGSAKETLQDLDERLSAATVRPPVPPPVAGGAPGNTACPSCGRTRRPHDQFCTHCGTQLVDAVRQCPSCKGYPGPDDRFCIFCGAALSTKE